jgi:uncharacterized protein
MSQPETSAEPSPDLAPVLPEERIVVLDVLRGFALFGILVMNMPAFNTPWASWALDPRLFPALLDRAADFVSSAVFAGKANSIFSFLFGVGMTIQLGRAEARGGKIAPMYLRRLAVLFLIGAAHAILIWSGDVLHIYAVLGLLLLAVRRASDKTIFAIIALCLVAPVARSAWGLYYQEPPLYPISYYVNLAHEQMRAYQQGSYAEQVAARLLDYKEWYVDSTPRLQGGMWTFPVFSVTMLLGFYAGRKRLFESVQANAPAIRRAMFWCFGLGIAAAVAFAVLRAVRPPPTGQPTLIGFLIGMLYNVNRPLLCVAYIAAITLLFQRERARKLLMSLAPVGSMPLTNYLMQSVIATTIYNSYGFGLFGKVGPALGLVFTVAIFGVQIVYSRAWLTRFRFGPLEWLWRGAAYGRLPPLRIRAKQATQATSA